MINRKRSSYPKLTIMICCGVLLAAASLLLGTVATHAQESEELPKPVGYWRFENFGNRVTQNSVTQEFDATLVNDVQVLFDTPDNNVGFGGFNTVDHNRTSLGFNDSFGYVEVAKNPAYAFTETLTAAAWINLTDVAPDQKIVGKQMIPINGSGSRAGFALRISRGRILVEVFDTASTPFGLFSGNIAANTWTHVAFTWKSGDQFAIYINGVMIDSTQTSANPIDSRCSTDIGVGRGGCNVIIGSEPWEPGVASSTTGNIDEVLLFDQALSAEQIAQLAQRTFIVTTAADNVPTCSGSACALQPAIQAANGAPNGALRDRIHFDMLGATTIMPNVSLPTVTDAVIIDGLSQPGADCESWPPTIQVALDGGSANAGPNGLTISADDVTVRGLNIRNNRGAGVRLGDAESGLLDCNLIGTNLLGTGVAANSFGVSMSDSNFNTISRNVISGNTIHGVQIVSSDDNRLVGNYIGTDVNGNVAIVNGGTGISMMHNQTGQGSPSNSNIIGGAEPGERNLISGNEIIGILLADAINSTIQGNYIGTDISGTGVITNGGGIWVAGASLTVIGGGDQSEGKGNRIANNDGFGVLITGETGVRNFVIGNEIYNNGGLGIDLGATGFILNDEGDVDSGGANNLQNFPVLSSAMVKNNMIDITGTLNSTPDAEILIELFASTHCDPSGHGEGERSLGFVEAETDSNGNFQFAKTIAAPARPGEFVTATATSNDGTSEFSECIPIDTIVPEVGFSSSQLTVNEGDGTATVTVSLSVSVTVPISVLIKTELPPASALPNATPGDDFVALPVTKVVIPAGATSATIGTTILDDTIDEPDEGFAFTITLLQPGDSNVDSGPIQTILTTIVDNDEPAAPNTPPTAQEVVVAVPGSNIPVILEGNDVDGDNLTYIIVTEPINGSLTGIAPNLTYQPNPGFEGIEEFSYKVNDGSADSAVAGVRITVTNNPAGQGNNTPPTAQEVVVAVPGSNIPVILEGNDVDGDNLTFIIVTQPANGTLSGAAPNLTYKPNPGFEDRDSFTYKVNDGLADSTVATVTINVTDNAASTTMKSIYLPFVSKQ